MYFRSLECKNSFDFRAEIAFFRARFIEISRFAETRPWRIWSYD
jgi:hypothetical protein